MKTRVIEILGVKPAEQHEIHARLEDTGGGYLAPHGLAERLRKSPARLYSCGARNIPFDAYSRVRLPGGRAASPCKRRIDCFVTRATGFGHDEVGFPAGWAATARDGRTAACMVPASYRSSREGIKVRL
jgi:hypothetical protein